MRLKEAVQKAGIGRTISVPSIARPSERVSFRVEQRRAKTGMYTVLVQVADNRLAALCLEFIARDDFTVDELEA